MIIKINCYLAGININYSATGSCRGYICSEYVASGGTDSARPCNRRLRFRRDGGETQRKGNERKAD